MFYFFNKFFKHLQLNFKHDSGDALVFGDHHHDSLCIEKLKLNNSLSVAFVNYDKEYMMKEKAEQMERYKLHWDVVLFNEQSFDYHLDLLEKIKDNK